MSSFFSYFARDSSNEAGVQGNFECRTSSGRVVPRRDPVRAVVWPSAVRGERLAGVAVLHVHEM